MTTTLAASVRGPQAVCRLRAGQTLAGLINGPQGAVFVSGGGFIAGQIMQTVISPDLCAYELGWFASDRSGLRLLRAFEAWAAEQGATLVKMSANGGAAQRILERRGYTVAEVQMVKAI
ncbi:hypothetical protein J7354_01580 [Sulfitobacter sp. R18_2]|uniref:hypothetical protein n=1 Tax=Sulfitobacter sp. R18_2 TaxID=2821105 RepID=UPI001AD98054|nr:hypothetical protein [Sulfitobacter sp. R18_2]MBO9437341.1 hypothetical protein [Sulfitobacter sp. R18_2]